MKSRITLLILIAGLSINALAQNKYICRNGHASFYSKAMAENIEAHNNQTSAILDQETGELAVSIPITGFQFEKALMQEHFNENYMESGKFPKATFRGKIVNYESIDLNASKNSVDISGDITIHGVTKPLLISGVLENVSGDLVGSTKFDLKVADFEIKIPKVVINNIAETIHVTVDLELKAPAN